MGTLFENKSGKIKEKSTQKQRKQMYKKIEKSSKICLCMIKKTSCPYTQKSIPPKNKNRPLNIKFKKTKKNEKNPKEPEKVSEVQSFFDFKNSKIKKRKESKQK